MTNRDELFELMLSRKGRAYRDAFNALETAILALHRVHRKNHRWVVGLGELEQDIRKAWNKEYVAALAATAQKADKMDSAP